MGCMNMAYTKITLEVVIYDDDSEILEQVLNDAMDRIEGHLVRSKLKGYRLTDNL
jgi:hypothetical protein